MTDDGLDRLLVAANAGDGAAYRAFLVAVTPVLRGIVRARAPGLAPDQQEDIVQEALIAIHRKRQTWEQGRPLRPWLYAIARHKVADAFRARGIRADVTLDDAPEAALIAPDAPDPVERRDAERLVARLDPRSGDLLRAAAFDGETPAETAKRLGMTEGAVRVALHRAVQRLRRLRGENADD